MTPALGCALAVWAVVQCLAAVARFGFKVKRINLGWVSVSIQTQALNRKIYTVGRRSHNELRQWFGIGVLVAGMLGISAAVILLRELWQVVKWADEASTSLGAGSNTGWVMVVALPGVTVPWSHALYLWLATAISFCVHEAGHAFAAAAEGVGIHHVALFSIFLLPGAFIALDTETMAVLSPSRTLRIICGGVWHNAVLCISCWFMALLLPILLAPAYTTGRGAVVRSMLEDSSLSEHLRPADLITSINECRIQNQADWMHCLTQEKGTQRNYTGASALTATHLLELLSEPAERQGNGYCIPQEVQAHSLSCSTGASQQCLPKEVCFREVRQHWRHLLAGSSSSHAKRHNRSSLERGTGGASGTAVEGFAGGGTALDGIQTDQGICVGIRDAANLQPCGLPLSSREAGVGKCPAMSACFTPELDKAEELLRICFKAGYRGSLKRSKHSQSRLHMQGDAGRLENSIDFSRGLQEVVVGRLEGELPKRSQRDLACPEFLAFVGNRVNLLQAIEVTNYAPAASWVPMGLPHMIEQLLAYMFAVSAALALLNMAPVYGLDGEAALKSLLLMGEARDGYLHPSAGHSSLRIGRRLLQAVILKIGTAVLAVLLFVHLLKLSGYDAAIMRTLATIRHLLTFSVRWG